MKSVHRFATVAALAASVCAAAPTLADIVDAGTMRNVRWGEIGYEGDFAPYVSAEARGDEQHRYTLITIDVTSLLASIGEQGLASISVFDTGVNAYGDSPGADVDLFRLSGISDSIDQTMSYHGPTQEHLQETHDQLWMRTQALDWGTNGDGLGSMTYVSLGRDGRLTIDLSEVQPIGGGDEPILLTLGEAGTAEQFRVEIETGAVPAPGAIALVLGAAALAVRGSRRRA